ncbi:hypothetical protein LP419_30250 [Massilia sp. H-1]|nr:hypothetical protein LP419_30250 [Massilia sp. H-1]
MAGLNADDEERVLALDLSFLGQRTGYVITDGATEREFRQAAIVA